MRKRLQHERKAAGLTQQQVANQLQIDLRYYKAIESGERLGGITIWDALEDMFNVHQRVLREIHPGTKGNP